MYKIYINETPLILAKLKSMGSNPVATKNQLVARYTGMPKMLLNYTDMLEKSQRFEMVYLYSEHYEQLIKDFKSQFKYIEAAGGVVFNPLDQILGIYRRGSWDLPKGKIDPGESPEEAGLREVNEETGVTDLSLITSLPSSYHTYRLKSGKRVLKKTYWYKMHCPNQNLIPQTEEDIEKAVWINPNTFLKGDYPMYNTIRDVLNACLKL